MVFKSTHLESKFQQEGYVTIHLLSEAEVQDLIQFVEKEYPKDYAGFHSTHFLKDRDLKRRVHEKIVAAFEVKLQEYLHDYKAIFGNFMIKAIGENSRMPLHADWTYVDEERFQSLGVWCPLVDTDDSNGMLGVVPYSHLIKTNKRGPQIPSVFTDFNQYIIDNYGKRLPIKAGEIVVYNHRTLHFSNANTSEKTRIAINLVTVPKIATLYHYARLGNSEEINCFVPKNATFFIEYDHFETPSQSDSIEQIDEVSMPLTKTEIDKALGGNRKNIFQKFFSLLKK